MLIAAPVLAALRASAAAHDRGCPELGFGHGFVHIVRWLAAAAHRIEALPVSTLRATTSLCALADLEANA